ncbi:MAG: hypothetical protein IPG59_13760 [Candidatus Melainabacteria bacterium]|nr:MAG: hypothetical protein IPG59_13760 [Candidatus Melainabacteria bacterium]
MTPELILTVLQYGIGFACTYAALNFVAPALFKLGVLNRGAAPNSLIDIKGPVSGFLVAVAIFIAGWFGSEILELALAGASLPALVFIKSNVWAAYAFSITCAAVITWLITDLASRWVYVANLGVAFVISISDTVLTHFVNLGYHTFVMPQIITVLKSIYGV